MSEALLTSRIPTVDLLARSTNSTTRDVTLGFSIERMSLALRSRLPFAATAVRKQTLSSSIRLQGYATGSGKESPLNVDKQSKTGVQPSYGPIGVNAALKYTSNGEYVLL